VWTQLEPHLDAPVETLIGPAQIEIRPYPSADAARAWVRQLPQRVYMSATIGQPGDLQRRLGTRQIVTLATPAGPTDHSTGRRTFAINPGPEPSLSDTVLSFAA